MELCALVLAEQPGCLPVRKLQRAAQLKLAALRRGGMSRLVRAVSTAPFLLGGSLKLKDEAGAIAAWEDYVARYPTGDATARIAYEAGKLHAARGRDLRARAMFTAAMAADPVSYFALRAGLGESVVHHWARIKRSEAERHAQAQDVTDFERREYLSRI